MRKDLEVSRGARTPSRTDFDEMFDRALRNPFSLFDDMTPMMSSQNWFQPQFDVDENEEAYLISVDLPGVKKENIKVDLSGNVLTIAGERRHSEESKGGRYMERSYGSFQRSFTLPNTVDIDKIEANLEDGVLNLALPKSAQSKGRKIEVQPGQGSFFSKLVGSKNIGAKKKDEKESKEGASHGTH
jgi:HSP20 family protein